MLPKLPRTAFDGFSRPKNSLHSIGPFAVALMISQHHLDFKSHHRPSSLRSFVNVFHTLFDLLLHDVFRWIYSQNGVGERMMWRMVKTRMNWSLFIVLGLLAFSASSSFSSLLILAGKCINLSFFAHPQASFHVKGVQRRMKRGGSHGIVRDEP